MAEVSNIRIRPRHIRITDAGLSEAEIEVRYWLAWFQAQSYADMAPWFQAERDAAVAEAIGWASRPGRQEGPGAVPGPRWL
jgi:hypothetical protein